MKPPKAGSANGLKAILKYIVKESKTIEDLIYGKDCSSPNSYDEMMLTKEMWNKTDGRQYCHIIQSFSPNDHVTPEIAHQIGIRLIDEFAQFSGFEMVMATHKDKDHIHNHIVLNSVNAVTGLKWEQQAKDLVLLKEYSNKLCKEYNLAEIQLGSNKRNQSYGEWKNQKAASSWKDKLESDIRECIEISTNRIEFFHYMNEKGYDVTWTNERKYVTFELPNGRKCRNSKLSDTEFFSKDNLQKIIDDNYKTVELSDQCPDLWLDAMRMAGRMLQPDDPDCLLNMTLSEDLSHLKGKALKIAILKLKKEHERELDLLRKEIAKREESHSAKLSDVIDAFEELIGYDDGFEL